MNENTITNRPLVTVAKPDKLFPAIKWLAKALSKDPTRYQINFIHCEVNDDAATLVAIDGRRLHKIETAIDNLFGITEGGYSVKLSAREALLVPETPDTVGNFPNWRQVIPDYSTHPKQDEVIKVTVLAEKVNTLSKATALLNAANPGKEPLIFNDQFLADALGQGTLFGAKGEALWQCETVEQSPLVMVRDDGAGDTIPATLTAVVMPMRLT